MRATVAPSADTHGPIDWGPNPGLRRRWSAAAASARMASVRRHTIHLCPVQRRARAQSDQRASPAMEALAASIDHRGVMPQAPNGPEPSPYRFQGRNADSVATAKPIPASGRGSCLTRPGGDGGGSVFRSSGRHSRPRTRPLTGSAQVMQSQAPQPSQRATAFEPPWMWHLDALSCTGQAYAARCC